VGGNLFTPASVLQSVAGNAPLCWRLLSVREWCGEIKDRRKNGEPYCAFVTFSTIQDKQGGAIRLLARFQDITQQKFDQEALAESEERFSEVARMVGEWLWEQDASGRYTYCSEAAEDILGFPPKSLIGKHYLDLMTEADRQHWTSELPPTERVNQPFGKLINHYLHRDGHEVYTESTGVPLINDRGETVCWRGVDMDITERKRVEDAVRLRERAIEAASVGIAIADARQPNFPNIYVNSALCRITGYTERELLGRSLRLLQGKGTEESTVDTIRTALASGGGCEVVIRNYRKDGSGFWNELLLSPVHDDAGELTHYIGVIADISERRRAEDERHELEIARQIQMSLLPKQPLILPDIEVAGVCIPAAQVGGDYYDFIQHGDCVDIVIADVSGHSVGAALIMAEMRSTLKAELRRTRTADDSTAQLLSALNELLHVDLNGSDLFITMFYLRYNRTTRMIRYASAGHNPPLLLRASARSCTGLDADGLILGVNRTVHFVEEQQVLEPGDQILFYTDGVTETQNVRGDFFGGQRLCHAFSDLRQLSPDQTLEQALDQLRDFRGAAMFLDDITMVAFRVK
jgi:sigma-B regulation protein RsbU (phosphoserine phosphatase)